MKKIIILFISIFALASSPQAHVLEELWNKYAPEDFRETKPLPTPGILPDQAPGTGESLFSYQWKYRPRTFEIHYDNPERLAKGIYSLALFAGDISGELPIEKFYKGVTGFHYSSQQIADWLNDILARHAVLPPEENELVGDLLKGGVIRIGRNGFMPGDGLSHVLGAAPGKKRTFADNLLHERLHVFWDEDSQMREQAEAQWARLNDQEKDAIRKRLKNYNQGNEKQLLEEWAILEAEKNNYSIK